MQNVYITYIHIYYGLFIKTENFRVNNKNNGRLRLYGSLHMIEKNMTFVFFASAFVISF